MDWSTPGLPVHHQLLESTQTHVHCVGDVIQPSHPLSSPSPPAAIFPSIRVFSNKSALRIRWPKYWSSASTSVPPMNTQDWSPLGWAGWISLPFTLFGTLWTSCIWMSVFFLRLGTFQSLFLQIWFLPFCLALFLGNLKCVKSIWYCPVSFLG